MVLVARCLMCTLQTDFIEELIESEQQKEV